MFRKDGGMGFTIQGSEMMEGWVSLSKVQKGWRVGFHYPRFRKNGGLGFTNQGSERMEGWVSLTKFQKR